ncbi:MAG: ATP synthase F1 subunit gamma [Candidatus Lightella neohaematopini]|nr:ATP synthase F1 subunit gamma [Candidatus Lightella neohaematopini]
MFNIKEIKNKINSIKNTKKITSAMEMIAFTKMNKVKTKILFANKYLTNVKNIINNLLSSNLDYKPKIMSNYNYNKIIYLIISTEKGLVGTLNINLFRKVLININKHIKLGKDVKLILIGAKAINFFSNFNINILAKINNLNNNLLPEEFRIIKINQVVKNIISLYNSNIIDACYLASNKFTNVLNQVPEIIRIIPFIGNNKIRIGNCYIYESDIVNILDKLIYCYIESSIYLGLLNNLTSEQASRMVTMQLAKNNCDNLTKELELIYNQTRQNNITQELNEIISGNI